MSKLTDAALRYAKAGYRVVLLHGINANGGCTCEKGKHCKGPGKHPRLKGWPNKATTDKATLLRQFAAAPHSNIGIMPPEDCVIVDVDPRNGGVTPAGIPARTPTQFTGGGGVHYIVKVPEGAQLPKMDGVDYRRADKKHYGQVAVYPSQHYTGGEYSWKPGAGFGIRPALWAVPTVPVDAEQDLPPLIAVKEALDAPVQMIEDWLGYVPSEEYGDWINVGQALKHAYGDDAFDLWNKWSESSDKYPGEDELRTKWDTFDHNRDRALRTLRSVRHMAQQHGWRYTPPELEFSSDLWQRGLVSDLVNTPAPDLEWVIGQVLPRGKVVMLGGPGGAGKSFLMLVLAIQHGLGLQLLGDEHFGPTRSASANKVISFTAEDDRDDIHRRLEAVFEAYMLAEEQRAALGATFSVQCTRGKDWRLVEDVGGQLVASKACDLIIDKLRNELGLSMLMLDPSIMFAGVDENDNAAAAVYMRVLDRIARELNVAVLVGTHTNKALLSADTVDQSSIRGASAFVDNARGSWILRTMTEDEATLHGVAVAERFRYAALRVTKNNYGPTGAFVWLERVAGGALRVAQMPTLAPGAMPPIAGGVRAMRSVQGRRAAAMQAHALQLVQYINANADELLGGVSDSLRSIGNAIWAAEPDLSTDGVLKRTQRVIEYCEGNGLLVVQAANGRDRGGARRPGTYLLTESGKEMCT